MRAFEQVVAGKWEAIVCTSDDCDNSFVHPATTPKYHPVQLCVRCGSPMRVVANQSVVLHLALSKGVK